MPPPPNLKTSRSGCWNELLQHHENNRSQLPNAVQTLQGCLSTLNGSQSQISYCPTNQAAKITREKQGTLASRCVLYECRELAFQAYSATKGPECSHAEAAAQQMGRVKQVPSPKSRSPTQLDVPP